MSDEQQLERIFNKLEELSKGQATMTNRLVKIETNWDNHIAGSVPLREMVNGHEQSIQRLKGAGWILGVLWTILLGIVGFFARNNGVVK